MAEYTFIPEFSEFVAFYNGLIDVWIGDGTLPVGQKYTDKHGVIRYKGGTAGYLYGIYHNGAIDEIGFVSDYEAAKKYYEDHGIQTDMTYEDWVNYLKDVPENAAQARLWAIGLTEGEYSSGISSREQANRSMIWAVGSGTDTDNGAVDNNSKYWAEQSKSYADGTDLAGNPVQDREHDSAVYFKDLAKDWATKSTKVEGNLDSAKTYAENSSDSADLSQQWATGTIASSSYVQGQSSKDYSDKSKEWATSPNPVETIGGVTYESAKTYAMNCGQQIDARIEVMRQATDAANVAADKLDNMSATATTLPYTSSATSAVRTESGHYVVDFGIPQGEPDYLATSVVDDVNESGIVFDWSANREALSAKTIYFDSSVQNPKTIYNHINELSAKNIYFDPTEQNPTTIYDYIQFATDAQIEALFE